MKFFEYGLYLLIFLLPLEYIGAIEIFDITVRPSQGIALVLLVGFVIYKLLPKFYSLSPDVKSGSRPQRRDSSKGKIWGLNLNVNVIILIAFLVWSAFCLFNSPNLGRGIQVWLFTAFTILIGAFLVPALVKNEKILKNALMILILSAFLVSLFGLYQFIGDMLGLSQDWTGLRYQYTKDILGFTRVQATFLEPLYFGNFLLIPLSLILMLLLMSPNSVIASERSERGDLTGAHRATRDAGRFTPARLSPYGGSPAGGLRSLRSLAMTKWVLFAILSVLFLNLILTTSRGAWLGFLASLAVILILLRKQISWRGAGKVGMVLVLTIFVAGLLLKTLPGENLVNQFAGHGANLTSGAAVEERSETFKAAWESFKRHPVLGLGPGGFGPDFHWDPYLKPALGWPIVNNIYLELLAETGFIGLGLILTFFIILIIKSIKKVTVIANTDLSFPRKRESMCGGLNLNVNLILVVQTGLLASLIGTLIQYNTFSVLYITHIWVLIGLLIASLRIPLFTEPVEVNNGARQSRLKS